MDVKFHVCSDKLQEREEKLSRTVSAYKEELFTLTNVGEHPTRARN